MFFGEFCFEDNQQFWVIFSSITIYSVYTYRYHCYEMHVLHNVVIECTLIRETASSACIIRVDLVGCPSQTSCVEPKYRARNRTPSISTAGSQAPTIFALDNRQFEMSILYFFGDGKNSAKIFNNK